MERYFYTDDGMSTAMYSPIPSAVGYWLTFIYRNAETLAVVSFEGGMCAHNCCSTGTGCYLFTLSLKQRAYTPPMGLPLRFSRFALPYVYIIALFMLNVNTLRW